MVTPDQRSRECIRRYFGFRTTSPRRRRGQVAASTRASPPHAWRWGTWGRCRRAQGAQCAWLEHGGCLQGTLSWPGCCFGNELSIRTVFWAHHEAPRFGAAENAMCVCDGGERGALHQKGASEFFWNVEEDFKPVPECWIPAKEIEQLNGNPMPDENGHIPGWVPVEKNNKQYCWHSSVVNYEFEVALVLKHHPDDPGLLEISAVPLSDLLEQTLELIGTNINGNPYGLGSKKHPLHLLIPHGAFQIRNLPTLKHNDLLSWFEGCREGKIEGIVWHCNDGCLIKVHRHHLGLCWPIPDTYMNSKPVIINMNLNKYDHAFDTKSLFNLLSKIDNQKFGRLRDIILDV
uniref:RNA ligase 1 n=1 Tax=Felis catus TaxID=9685 RepID=A0ABI7XD84_FELCA